MTTTVLLCGSKLAGSKFIGDDFISWSRILSGLPKNLAGGTGMPALGIARGTVRVLLAGKPGRGDVSRFREVLSARLV